jgi:hypothetical protein
MARTGREGGPARRTVVLALVAGLALAAAGIAAYLVVGGGSSTPTAKPDPLQGLQGHRLLSPECTPLKGRRWIYPVGPPVAGLPPLVAKINSNLYEVFAINYSCKEASKWIQRLSRARIPIKKSGNETVLKGPAGYFCSAWPDATGRAYAGGCQIKGGGSCTTSKYQAGRPYAGGRGCEITGGKKAFGWNWNVANRRVVFAHDENGRLRLVHVSGADTNVIFRSPEEGSYELQVLNTSGIGYLNGFTWTPPEGWKVTRIKNSTGAACSLTPAGKIFCSGSVGPPTCLCTGDGGSVSIKFAAAPTTKTHGFLFGGSAAQFRINKMTPVPYIIPGTPEEAAKRGGV